ncbi:MAG: SPASM domain-containing protein [Verrucomicrobia bacterium]|nr:SPASM domain-containing protein [Verrucomicrobiota bacterium]
MSRRYYCDESIPGQAMLDLTQRPVTCREEYLSAMEACYNFRTVRPFPLKMMIESSSRCMLRCAMCPRDRMTRSEGDMPFELFEKVIDEAAASGLYHLSMHQHGEPLMNERLPEMVQAAKARGVPIVNLTTNGVLLDETASCALLEAGLDTLVVSFDGITRDTYAQLRGVEKHYDRVRDNMLRFVRLRAAAGASKPFFRVHALRTPDVTAAQVEAFRTEWTGVADHVGVGEIASYGSGNEMFDPGRGADVPRVPCRHLWQQLIVLHTGAVVPCCVDINAEVTVGNVYEESLASIWTGERLNHYRAMHLAGRADELPGCADCIDVFCRAY